MKTDCGCYYEERDRYANGKIYYCPLHAAAGEMLDALRYVAVNYPITSMTVETAMHVTASKPKITP